MTGFLNRKLGPIRDIVKECYLPGKLGTIWRSVP
jgi:hypothetical protein